MHVAVGSENPVKRRAVARVFDAPVETRRVDSGVSEQPHGHAETIVGAKTRARRAFGSDVAFGVGLEGGVAEVVSRMDSTRNAAVNNGDGIEGLFVVMWAAVTDGRRVEIGAGPSVRLPDPIAREVVSGRELGPLLDDRLGVDGLARNEGAIGLFTDGRITREDALADAVACAAGPLLSD